MREQARIDLHQMQLVELVQNLFRQQLLQLREDSKLTHKHLRKIYNYSNSLLIEQQEEREKLADENLKLKLEQLRDQLATRQNELEDYYRKIFAQLEKLSEAEEKGQVPAPLTPTHSNSDYGPNILSLSGNHSNASSPAKKPQKVVSSDNLLQATNTNKKLKENQEREFLRERNELEKQVLNLKKAIIQNQHEQELAILEQNFWEKNYLEDQLFRLFKMQLEQTGEIRTKLASHYSDYLSSSLSSPSEESNRLELLQHQHTEYQSHLDKQKEEQKELMQQRHAEQLQQLEKEIQATNVWHEEEELRLWSIQKNFLTGKSEDKRESKKISKRDSKIIKRSETTESLSHSFYMFILDGEL